MSLSNKASLSDSFFIEQDFDYGVESLNLSKKNSDFFAQPKLDIKSSFTYKNSEIELLPFNEEIVKDISFAPDFYSGQLENFEKSEEQVLSEKQLQKIKEKIQVTSGQSLLNFANSQSLVAPKNPFSEELIEEQPFQEVKEESEKQNKNVNKCKCSKSNCVKMYCQCFKNQGFCGGDCSCISCKNIEENIDQILKIRKKIIEKDPSAFIEKKRYNGCKCHKTKCSQMYCECYSIGVACGKYCKCSGCQNCSESFKKKQQKTQKK